MSAAAGVGLFPIPEEGNSNSNTPPLTGASNPASLVPSTVDGVASRAPPNAVNILRPLGAGAAAQRCAAAGADMSRCLSVTDQIAELEKQSAVACTQCDQIRAQITDLRKQIAAPVPVAPTGAALRYGPATKVGAAPPILTSTNTDTACKETLPALRSYATGEDRPVAGANYADKIKPLVDLLSKDSRAPIKALRDELKSYDPPGAFMRTFGRRAKNKAPLSNVAGRVSTTLGCPAPVVYGPLTPGQAARRNIATANAAAVEAAAAASKAAAAQKYGEAAQTFVSGATGKAAEAAATAAELRSQAEVTIGQANAARTAAEAERVRLANIERRAREANAARARIVAAEEKRKANAAAAAAHAKQIANMKARGDNIEEILGKMEGGARRKTRRIRSTHHKGSRKAHHKTRKTAKK